MEFNLTGFFGRNVSVVKKDSTSPEYCGPEGDAISQRFEWHISSPVSFRQIPAVGGDSCGMDHHTHGGCRNREPWLWTPIHPCPAMPEFRR
jgi:hypothetical protein